MGINYILKFRIALVGCKNVNSLEIQRTNIKMILTGYHKPENMG